MSIKVAINGFGRIGRCTLRAIYELGLQNELEVVAINASGDRITSYNVCYTKLLRLAFGR